MPKTAVDVLVFDSGVGGLSILNAIRPLAPGLSYAFLADNAGLPYGDKSESWLVERVPQVLDKVLQRIECKVLVIACNTASTIVLPALRKHYSFPVIGVVPAIKPAVALSQSKIIGLLATPATIARPYTDALIDEFARDCEVVRLGSSRLVSIAEEKLRGGVVDPQEIDRILEPFASNKPDVVVLGCTHFPLLRSELAASLPLVRWIDSGEAVAKRVLHFGLGESTQAVSRGLAFITKDDIQGLNLLEFGLDQVLNLDLDAR